MRWALLDTNVYIGHWERGLYEEALAGIRQQSIVRHSAIVLSELRRGARTAQARRAVEALWRGAREIWAPEIDDWWEAGRIIREIGDARDWDRNRRRAFQNDCLLALTARRHGATIVSANREDFEILRERLSISLWLL